MPTSRSPSTTPSTHSWPAFLPPSLSYLSDPRPHPDPASLPASTRYRPHAGGWGASKPRTMQDDLDDLDRVEDEHYNRTMDTRQYGYSWLVPLGRQSTHDEDADSAFSTSPHHGLDTTLDLALSPPHGGAGGFVPPAAAAADDAPVVDLDAEIEDADATTGSDDDAGSGTDTGSETGRVDAEAAREREQEAERLGARRGENAPQGRGRDSMEP
ncbi:hypothetical protein JCM10450v2_002009 [Rhodotorula kratochvilovae]